MCSFTYEKFHIKIQFGALLKDLPLLVLHSFSSVHHSFIVIYSIIMLKVELSCSVLYCMIDDLFFSPFLLLLNFVKIALQIFQNHADQVEDVFNFLLYGKL